jgi:uncharacterized membrane protein YphA (DoxX/SURF4 family)
MDIVMIIGRILFSYVFIAAGLNHLAKAKPYIEFAQTQKVKFPRASTYLSGLVLLLGGLSSSSVCTPTSAHWCSSLCCS